MQEFNFLLYKIKLKIYINGAMITLSEIEDWRNLNGLTKKELASKLEISYPFLVDILNGKKEISSATAAKFEVLKRESVRVCAYDDVRAFTVRMTQEEYIQLCRYAKVENLPAEQAEKVVRDLLQKTFDEAAREVPKVVDVTQEPPERLSI